MSAFPPISCASPPGADLPGGAAVRLLMTHCGHSWRRIRLARRRPGPMRPLLVDARSFSVAATDVPVWEISARLSAHILKSSNES